MTVTQEQIFAHKKALQQEIEQYEVQLQELIKKQEGIKHVEALAASILEYNELTRHIGDRAHVFSLLSGPIEQFRHPLVRSQFFSYIEAAETVGIELVDFLATIMLDEVRYDVQSGEADGVDLIHAGFKEYVIPGKIIAESFLELDDILNEMNRFCRAVDAAYNDDSARQVLKYAFDISITADTKMEPTIQALREMDSVWLTNEDRADLLDKVEEHLSVLRYDEMKNQQIAMDKAIVMMEKWESKK